jgi:hypothetical protein
MGLTMGQLLNMPSTSCASHFHLRRAIHEIETFLSRLKTIRLGVEEESQRKRDEDVDDATEKDVKCVPSDGFEFLLFHLVLVLVCLRAELGNSGSISNFTLQCEVF